MHSIESALARDFVRRGALMVPAMLLVMIGLPMWILAFIGASDIAKEVLHERIVLHVTLTLSMGFLAAVAVFQSLGKLPRFFMRPISAARLVAIQMTLGAGTIALMYACSASLLNLGGAGWPVLGPALFLGATLACAMAAIWSLEGTILGQSIGCAATTLPLTIWFNRCYGARIMGDWNVMWQNPTAAEALTLVAITLAAYGVAIIGVTRTRRGDLWDFAALQRWMEQQRARGAAPRTFANPMTAQLWCEWREKLGPGPACLLILTVLLACSVWGSGLMPTAELIEFILAMPVVLLTIVGPLIFGLVAGNCGKDGKRDMKHVLATRPVTDRFIATALLRNCATSLALGFAAWLVGLLVIVGLAWVAGHQEAVLSKLWPEPVHNLSPLFLVVGMPLVSWTLTALMAALTATGRPWLWAVALFTLFGLVIAFVLIKQFVSPPVFDVVSKAWLAISGGLYAGGTAWAFVAASRQRLISAATILPVAAIWLLLSAGLVAISFPQFPDNFWLGHCLGVLTLVMLPFAAMPLAVRWNRHR